MHKVLKTETKDINDYNGLYKLALQRKMHVNGEKLVKEHKKIHIFKNKKAQ